MTYRHVQQRNARFVWRLNILGEVLRNIDEEDKEASYVTPSGAAYACDLLKFFIREKYGLKSTKTELSLPFDRFEDKARQEGLDLSDLAAVFNAMPWRAQEFIRDAGPLLEDEGKRLAGLSALPAGNSNYLHTLLVALPKRLNDALAILQKAKQLVNLPEETAATLTVLQSKVGELEAETRAEVSRLLGDENA